MHPISVIITALNEEKNIPDLLASLKGVDEIIVFDDGSTDKTIELSKSLGAKVIVTKMPTFTATQDDVDEFTHRLGFAPSFKANDEILNWEKKLNDCTHQAKHDWVLEMCCDERMKWDLDKIYPLMDTCDAISCRYQFNEKIKFNTIKLFKKSKTFWFDVLHCVIDGYNVKSVHSTDMEIIQYQEEREYRKNYCPALEYQFLNRNDIRSAYNLGKEYHNHLEHEKAIKMFNIYLAKIAFKPELNKVHTFLSANYWDLGDKEKAEEHCLKALKADPTQPNPYLLMAQWADPEMAPKWMMMHDKIVKGDII